MFPNGSIPSFLLSTSPSNSISKVKILSPKASTLPPLQHSPKRSLNNESLVKNQNYIKLSNKHSILRSFITVDKQDASLRDDTTLNRSFKRLSAAITLLRPTVQYPNELKAKITDTLLPIKHMKLRSKCRSVELAQNEWRTEENQIWAIKQGKTTKKKLNLNFQKFLCDLFEALDEDNNGKLSSDEFILPLLSYGVTNEPKYIEKALIHIFQGKDLDSIQIEKENFLSLFTEDSRADKVLQALEYWTKKTLNDAENLKKARRLSMGLILRTETRIEEVVPKTFCTIDQYVITIKQWWKDLVLSSNKVKKTQNIELEKVHKSKLMEFLMSNNLVSNKIEAFAMICEIENSGFVVFVKFEQIFFKALLKSALMNLATGLNDKKFAGSDSLVARLFRCQRKFMVSGVGVKKSLLNVQGRLALNAVCKYQSEHENCVKNKIFRDVKSELRKADEDIEERMHGYLYRINEDAEQYLDQWGNLKSLEGMWEIRDKVKYSVEKTVV